MKPIKRNLEYSGIYCIINIINNKRYIGSSKNIKRRLQIHRAELRHNWHSNSHLQRAWNKYGEKSFEYYVIEACSDDILLDREQYYIDTLKPEYNMNLIVTIPPVMTKEVRQKLSETRKRKIQNGEIPITHNKHVYQYDLEGHYIREFKSIRKAAKFNNIHNSLIHRCLNGKYGQGGGFQWSYTKEEKLNPFHKNTQKPTRKKVIVYNDTEYYEFKNAKECAEFFHKHIITVRDAILKNRHFLRKYTIKYKLPCE